MRGNSGVSGCAAGPVLAAPFAGDSAPPARPEAPRPDARPSTMTISLADVHRIAHLARIEIDAAHAEEVRAKLDAIFG